MRMLGDRNRPTPSHRYKQVFPPVVFPEEEQVTESEEHLERRLRVRDSLKLELQGRATVGTDQFVYWNATDMTLRVGPDVFVRLGVVVSPLSVFKTWLHGSPELAVEIVSPSDRPESKWDEKFARYQELGVQEVVRFDADAAPAERLRIWDHVDGKLLERETGERAEWSEVLGLWWVMVAEHGVGLTLRLARDPVGQDLLLTPRERDARAREAAEQARDDERRAREAAEQRVRELEAELGRRGGC